MPGRAPGFHSSLKAKYPPRYCFDMARRRRRGEYGKGAVFRADARDTWSIAWRENGVRRYEHSLPTEADARKRLAVVLGDMRPSAPHGPNCRENGPCTILAQKWLKDREATHRSAYDDANRWKNHLEKTLGRLKPNAVTIPVLKAFIASKGRQGLSTTTVNLLVRLLSTLYTDLVEAGHANANPCRQLSKSTRAST